MTSTTVRIRAYLFCSKPLSVGMNDLVNSVYGLMKGGEDGDGYNPDHEAFSGMKQTVGQLGSAVGDNSSHRHAAGIGQDGDRRRGQKQNHPKPGLRLEEIAIH